MKEEYKLVNKNGDFIGKTLNSEQKNLYENIKKGEYLPVVGIVIYNTKNQVLFQKRSKYKKSNPSVWGICGGKVNDKENFKEAGVREVIEEIGIKLNEEEFNLIRSKEVDKHYFKVYIIKKDINLEKCKIDIKEVEELRYFDIEEIDKIETEGTEWLEAFKEYVEKNEKILLKNEDV